MSELAAQRRLALVNGRIYTMDGPDSIVSALGIEGGRIAVAGEDADVLAWAGGPSEAFDLANAACCPGFTDSHVHLMDYATGLSAPPLEKLGSVESVCACVRQMAARAGPGSWIVAHGWDASVLGRTGTAPHRSFLDDAAPSNPVALFSKDGHSVWVNTAALREARIGTDCPTPPGGYVGRDPTTNELDGIFKENALVLINDAIPTPSREEACEAIRLASRELWSRGVTSVHDCSGESSLPALSALAMRREPCVRVFAMVSPDNMPTLASLGLTSGFGDERVRLGCVKTFADGSLGSRTALMFDAYEDDGDRGGDGRGQGGTSTRATSTGIRVRSEEEMASIIHAANLAGVSCAVHAIGDRANHEVLNAFENARERLRRSCPEGLWRVLRNRMEHVQCVSEDDLPRFKKLGVIASVQPVHAAQDRDMAVRGWGERCSRAYAYRSLLSAGARMAFGSDAPVEDPDPLEGIYAAVSRKRADERPWGAAWFPEQRLTPFEALSGYTSWAAFASGEEHVKGRVAPGMLADLVVLDLDLMRAREDRIPEAMVTATFVGGALVHGSVRKATG